MVPSRRALLTWGLTAVVLALGAVVAVQQAHPSYPAGSTRSTAPNGSRALYLWLRDLGLSVERQETALSAGRARLVAVVQPIYPLSTRAEADLDAIPRAGGTLLVAGDSGATAAYLRHLGVSLRYVPSVTSARWQPRGLTLPVHASAALAGPGLQPLLRSPSGTILAGRLAYRGGTVIALATAWPLSNEGLANDDVARFVYDTLRPSLSGGQPVVFDESHYTIARSTDGAPDLAELAVSTPVGRSIVLAALLVFLYLLLAGRRIGPALPPADPSSASRAMDEHVRSLAFLYRRAHQLAYARSYFAQRYRRAFGAARAESGPGPDDLIGRIEAAADTRQLVEAVRAADAALPGRDRVTAAEAGRL